MCLAFRGWLSVLLALAAGASLAGSGRAMPPPHHIDARAAQEAPAALPADTLHVCADPNNLPFSNARRAGFENQIADLLAQELGLHGVAYMWWPQRRGFIRSTLNAGGCDLVMGVPSDYERTTNTRPYYRSAYVFVTRRDRHLHLRSFDDPRLRGLSIGVHVIGDDYANVPPVEALARRGIVNNVRGYTVYGDYSQPDPPRALLDALVRGEIDVAIAWGPLAGYFARREPVRLALAPVAPLHDVLPMTFAISLGVRHGDERLRDVLDAALVRRHAEIEQVLDRYGVPQFADESAPRPRRTKP
jgi:mxaJ protein